MGIWGKGAIAILSIFILATFGFSEEAFAATVTWDGGAGTNNWSDPDNWDTNTVPPAGRLRLPPGHSRRVRHKWENPL